MKRTFSCFFDNESYQFETSASNSTSSTEELEPLYKKQHIETDDELYESDVGANEQKNNETIVPMKNKEQTEQKKETMPNGPSGLSSSSESNERKKSIYGLFSYRNNVPFNAFELKALYKCSMYHWIQYFCIVKDLDVTDEIIECFNFYHNSGIVEQSDLNNIFEIACNNGHTTFIKYLLERQDFTFDYYTFYKIYCTLAFNKKNSLIKILINYTNNDEELKYTPMGGAEIARYYGHDDTFELLGMHF